MAFHPKNRKRKSLHLKACLDPFFSIERADARLAEIALIPRALPEIALTEISTQAVFCERVVSLPLMILPMTGGTRRGKRLNQELAAAAEQEGIAVGMGSMRILLEDSSRLTDFALRSYAPSVPLIANISAVQLSQYGKERIRDMCQRLEVDAISIHLNSLQEYFQIGGERDFRELFAAIEDFCTQDSLPVMVKETGFGIRPDELLRLREAGVSYVDVSASGGSNWALVEGYRQGKAQQQLTEAFSTWGLPLGLLMLLFSRQQQGIIASGGIRHLRDLPLVLALGAEMAGMARPFLQVVQKGGAEAVVGLVQQYRKALVAAMLACGVRSVAELRGVPLQISASLLQEAEHIRDQLDV